MIYKIISVFVLLNSVTSNPQVSFFFYLLTFLDALIMHKWVTVFLFHLSLMVHMQLHMKETKLYDDNISTDHLLKIKEN